VSPGSYETVETDALVLGARGAGLRGAIAAAEAGARVLVICKSLLGKAHTVMAEWGVAAAMHNVAYQDTWEVHFADTMKGGKLINDWCGAWPRSTPTNRRSECSSSSAGERCLIAPGRPHPPAAF
jgi:hypothetical protein